MNWKMVSFVQNIDPEDKYNGNKTMLLTLIFR